MLGDWVGDRRVRELVLGKHHIIHIDACVRHLKHARDKRLDNVVESLKRQLCQVQTSAFRQERVVEVWASLTCVRMYIGNDSKSFAETTNEAGDSLTPGLHGVIPVDDILVKTYNCRAVRV